MNRKFVGWIVLILLIAGTVCGVTFGIMYNNVNQQLQASNNASYVESLEDRLDLLNSEKIELVEELEFYESQNKTQSSEINDLKAQIETLDSQILELEKELDYYKALLAVYEESNQCAVAFYVDDTLHEIILVEQNTTLSNLPETPTKEHYDFLGYALEGTTEIVDFSTYVVTEDVKFVAIFEHQMDGKYVAKASYDFGAFGFSEECYAELQITFAVENGALIDSEHSFNISFDFEELMGCTYDEYVEDYMTVSDLIQNENRFIMTLTDSQGDADGDVVITYDYTSDTWSVENNIGCAIDSSIEKI